LPLITHRSVIRSPFLIKPKLFRFQSEMKN